MERDEVLARARQILELAPDAPENLVMTMLDLECRRRMGRSIDWHLAAIVDAIAGVDVMLEQACRDSDSRHERRAKLPRHLDGLI